MSTPYLFAMLKTAKENHYPDEKQWGSKLLQINPTPYLTRKGYNLYLINQEWKNEQIKNNREFPKFDIVYSTDIIIRPKFK